MFIPADAMPRSSGSDDELVLLDRPPDGLAVLLDVLLEPDMPEPLGVAVDELPPLGDDTDEPVDDEPVAGDALGLEPLPTAACATRLQRSKSAWVGDDVCAWTVVTARSPAIETNAAVRFVVNMMLLLRDGFLDDVICRPA